MATDFFERQSDAQRSTVWLVAMFSAAVISIVAIVVVVAYAVVQSQMREPASFQQRPEQIVIPTIAGLVAVVVMLGGSLFKVFQLRSGGGMRVAESLGGRRIYPNTEDPTEKRLLNVVEEMALASGTPVPPVFLLDEPGINAFAAGYSTSDAVLGVTRGCAEQLSRDQLQGVIAHEFSHVLNGDMRMSIRLIGVLHGILLIGLTGQLIMRMIFYSGSGRSRNNNNNNNGGQIILVIIAIGVVLIVLGFLGTFFGNLIKAAVSRQREFLADASAVQFTRNPDGIAGALKRIGGFSEGSQLKTPAAAQASHMYFAQGVWEGFSGLWATHPPLEKRIKAIDPNWKGKFTTKAEGTAAFGESRAAGFAGYANVSNEQVPVAVVDHAVEQVGEPTVEHRDYASGLLASLPDVIVGTVHEPYGARAVVYSLLLDHQPDIRSVQMQVLAKYAKPDLVSLVQQLQHLTDSLDVRARLPLIDMALPALRSMTTDQYREFKYCFIELARADQSIDLFEWMLSQVLMRHLSPQYEQIGSPRTRYYGLQQLQSECATLLSVVAAAGNDRNVAQEAFQRGAAQLPELALSQRPPSDSALDDLRAVLDKFRAVSAKHRGRLVDACAEAICADKQVTWQEAELLRGISDLLGCPMPPLLVETKPVSA